MAPRILISGFEGTNKEGPSGFCLCRLVRRGRWQGWSGHSAVWAPDGRRLLYAHGADLYEANPDGSDARKLATLGARIGDVRVSPDGRKIRVTLKT